MKRIKIQAGDVALSAELNEGETARKVWDALPIEGHANVWGDEIYFEIPVAAVEERDARAEVTVGDIGYWPPGKAFCVFFGPTPVSYGSEPRAYSPVNLLGRVLDDATQLRAVGQGVHVRLTRAEVD
jgi:hypothetical protein